MRSKWNESNSSPIYSSALQEWLCYGREGPLNHTSSMHVCTSLWSSGWMHIKNIVLRNGDVIQKTKYGVHVTPCVHLDYKGLNHTSGWVQAWPYQVGQLGQVSWQLLRIQCAGYWTCIQHAVETILDSKEQMTT